MKILIIDDSKATQIIVRRAIEQLPYNSITTSNASNGIEGLEVIRTWEPDLVISDWYMPEMSGIEMLQALKREMLGIPVGFISTETADDKKQEAFDNGVVFYVQKPFIAEELHAEIIPIIESHINKKTATATAKEETPKIATYSSEKISLLIKIIKKFSNNGVDVNAIDASYFEREQFPCVLGLMEKKSDKKIFALILFDHNASCIIESTLDVSNKKVDNIKNKKIDNKTLIQCKLLTNNINQTILKDEDNGHLQLRSITIIDENVEVVESLMKKSWKKRIDLSISYGNDAKGVITLISS